MTADETTPAPVSNASIWQVASLICLAVVVVSVISCVAIAAYRSVGLTQLTVTATDVNAEPRDHNLPFFKQREALPDYQLIVVHSDGLTTKLGTKPNTSAVEGLTWILNEPVPVCEIAGLRLQDQDKLISDVITEVQVVADATVSDGYKFEFETERSASIGVQSFFRTPIGKAIFAGFVIAVVLMLIGAYCGIAT